MKQDQALRKNNKHSKVSDVKQFLQTIGLEKRYKNFQNRGCDQMKDLKDANSNELMNEFLITNYGERKAILNGIKKYFTKGVGKYEHGNNEDDDENADNKNNEQLNIVDYIYEEKQFAFETKPMGFQIEAEHGTISVRSVHHGTQAGQYN
eukprot:547926_1